MRKFTAVASAAALLLSLAAPAFAQNGPQGGGTSSGSAAPDRTAGSSNYTGKGRGGNEGANSDAGPSQNAGTNKDATHNAR